MARALTAEGKTTAVAVHANHPRELTESARSACRRLAAHGAMLVSQSVLLKGVNDDAETLIALMRAFVEAGVKPYYLHHGDLHPAGACRVPIAKGQELMRLLRARLSGLATPSYARHPRGQGPDRTAMDPHGRGRNPRRHRPARSRTPSITSMAGDRAHGSCAATRSSRR